MTPPTTCPPTISQREVIAIRRSCAPATARAGRAGWAGSPPPLRGGGGEGGGSELGICRHPPPCPSPARGRERCGPVLGTARHAFACRVDNESLLEIQRKRPCPVSTCCSK